MKIIIKDSTDIKKMEHHIKMRYAFAMSSFGRMFQPHCISQQMKLFCKEWSENIEEIPPKKDLYQVDRYFFRILE